MNIPHRSAALMALATLAAPGLAGCFEIKNGDTKTAEDVVKSVPKLVPRGSLTAQLDLDGSKLTIAARQTCALVEIEDVEHTTKTEKKFESGVTGGLVAMGLLGSVPLAGGIAMLADSPKVFDSNHDSRTYNPTGKGAAIALGTLLTTIGTVSVAVPLINAGRVAGSDTSTSTDHREGKTLRAQVACDGSVPATAFSVTAQAPGGPNASLGQTDAQGHMTSDLKVALASWFTTGVPPVSAGIYVNNQFVGEIKVDDLARSVFAERAQQDELAWTQAEAQTCGSLRTEAACARVRAYQTAFPTGRHVEEAVRTLAPLTPQPPVVAENPLTQRIRRAVQAAQSASNLAANKVRERAQKEQQKALLKAEEDAAKAGKAACEATCRKSCDEPQDPKSKTNPQRDAAECRTTCVEEACP